MTPIANAIRRMAAKGMSIDAIANAVEEMEFATEEKQALRREQNRIAQQNHRARQRDGADIADSADTVNALSSKKVSIKESKKERGGFVCPLDFKPNERDYEIGTENGHSHDQVDRKSTEMMEWSQANRNRAVARKSDWHLTLHGFLRRDGKKPSAPARGMTPEEYHRTYTQGGKGNGQAAETATPDGGGTAGSDHEEDLLGSWGTLHPDRTSKG